MKKIISILKKKSIPLDEFINIALYDKDIGFYMKKNPFGKRSFYNLSNNFKPFCRNDNNMVHKFLVLFRKAKKNFVCRAWSR